MLCLVQKFNTNSSILRNRIRTYLKTHTQTRLATVSQSELKFEISLKFTFFIQNL